jgi:hypothetical protein
MREDFEIAIPKIITSQTGWDSLSPDRLGDQHINIVPSIVPSLGVPVG